MATTSNTYTGNGSNKLFSITFPYLDTTDIDVYLNGTLQTVTTQYTFANATTVEFVTAPGAGATVLLRRSTNDTTLAATFFAGSSIRAADLNDNFDQVLYLAQETNNNVANAVAGQIPDGTITSNKIADDTIVNADVNSAAGILASKLSFTQSGTGATARTVDSKLKDVVSVKDFGAVGDGVTNDIAAIQLAMAAAAGKTLYFPSGTYLINVPSLSSIGVIPANTTFFGDGKASFLDIRATDTNYLNAFNASNDNVVFENLKIKLTLLAGGQGALFAFGGATSAGFRLSNCELLSSSSAANSTHFSYIINCATGSSSKTELLIENCFIHNWHFPLLKTNTSTSTQRRWKIVDNYFYDNGINHWAPNSPSGIHDDVLIQGNSFGNLYSTDTGLCHFVGLAAVTNCRITGNTMVGVTAGEAIHLEEGCRNIVIDGNTIEVGELTNQILYGDGIRLLPNNVGGATTYPSNVTITGNTIKRTGITGGVGIDLLNNFRPEPSTAWAAISNNIIDGFTYGIVVDPDVLTARVTNNILKSCTYGLFLPRGGSPLIAQNTFSSCATGVYGRGLIGPSYFNATTTPIDSEFDGMAATTGWSTHIKNITLPVGPSTTGVILIPIGSRLDGNLRWSFFAPSASTTIISGSHDLGYNGTTLTQTVLNSIAPGAITVSAPTVSGGNLVFNIFNNGAARTDGQLYCEFIGMHIFA